MKHTGFKLAQSVILAAIVLASPFAHTEESAEVHLYHATLKGPGDPVGTVTLEDSPYGLLITPALNNLQPGLHGFHLHENPDCGPAKKDGEKTAAAAAGGHYDPEDKGKHRGPYNPEGHLGDLPALYVNEEGKATVPTLAPKLEMADVQDRALIIHDGGDNYSGKPKTLGGGGSRVACGVIGEQ